MIPTAFLQAWSTKAPWPDLRQVEQDLIICRALCDLFNAPALAGKIAFRGGTAIHKLLFKQPLRYSEDIDLVQAHPEPSGGTVDANHPLGSVRRDCLDPKPVSGLCADWVGRGDPVEVDGISCEERSGSSPMASEV